MKELACVVAAFLFLATFTGVQGAHDKLLITSPEQLGVLYENEVEYLPPVPGPNEMWISPIPSCLQTDFKTFPSEFVNGLMAYEKYGVYVYDVYIIPDASAGELIFYNENYEELTSMESEISSALLLQSTFPGFYVMVATLIDYRDWLVFEAARAEQEEATTLESMAEALVIPMALYGMDSGTPPDPRDYIRAEIDRQETDVGISIVVSNGFTNAVEIYSTDDLLDPDWSVRATNLTFSGGFTNTWSDTAIAYVLHRYYVIGNADRDNDADGLVDAREVFIHRTDPSMYDTDGDGFSDGVEVLIDGTDPLDKYSVRLPSWITADGYQLKDADGTSFVMSAENYGGWLAWEHWQLKFEPYIFTNILGHVVGIDRTYAEDGASIADLYDLLVDNVDETITLIATEEDAYYGITTNEPIQDNPDAIGYFDAGDWLCFSNVVLMPGMTNLAVIYARAGDLTTGSVEIRLGATNGTLIGSFKTGHTGGWNAYDENIFYGMQSIPATTQDVYIVGQGAGGLGNFYAFRLYSSANTESLITQFRDTYFQTNELDRLKELGFNTIRLPFNHSLLMDETGTNWLSDGWTYLDRFIDECAKRRMYCILDLHGVPGGQNWYEQCTKKQGTRNRLWSVPKYQEQLLRLWDGISDRYATNPVVLGYDLINEPDPYYHMYPGTEIEQRYQAYTNYIVPMHSNLYNVVRSNDPNHLIFMEDNFHVSHNSLYLTNTPTLSSMGWSNVVYEFHSYEHVLNNLYTGELAYLNFAYETQKKVVDDNVRNCIKFMRERQTPVFLGEFQPDDPYIYDYAVRRYIEHGINWCHWNYKIWGWENEARPDQGWTGWGLAYRDPNYATNHPDIANDSYEDLQAAFAEYAFYTNYNALQRTLQNRNLAAAQQSQSNKFSELYVNTFDSGNADSINSSWVWEKVMGIGNAGSFWIQNQKAHLRLTNGSLRTRLMARKETEAWFDVGDTSGATFELDVCGFSSSASGSGSDAEVILNVTDFIHTNRAYDANSEAIIARLQYNNNAS
ncbi:MAG: carbohydrate-binding protein, partial [Spartobacteria bacterium]|nr:carbohydrate-binding protein [Spartobacteria bacterium]